MECKWLAAAPVTPFAPPNCLIPIPLYFPVKRGSECRPAAGW